VAAPPAASSISSPRRARPGRCVSKRNWGPAAVQQQRRPVHPHRPVDQRRQRAGQCPAGRLGEQNEAFYDGAGDQIFIDNTQTDLQYNRSLDILGTLGLALSDEQSLDLLAQYYDSGNHGSTGIYFPT
jgi:hypothetical protein